MASAKYINYTLGGDQWIPAFLSGINQQLCVKCMSCLTTCPAAVFLKTVKGTIEAKNRKRCIGCAVCRKICPRKAITCLTHEKLAAQNRPA
jgi:Pyruvate/2-oxoacid:ferredoxin oxidoreductase delta subunit